MAPGTLPCTSNWFGDVTSASATSALVSDTREIAEPTSISVERPTVSRTALESLSGSGSPAATALAGIAAATVAPGATCASVACGVPKTPMMNICTPHAAAHFCCPVIRIVLLLRHAFLRALVSADDFYRGGRRGRLGNCYRLRLPRG